MGLFLDAVKTFQLLATTIALFSVHDLSNITYNPSHSNELQCGFSYDFNHFLTTNNFSTFNLSRPDVKCGCFGGKQFREEILDKTPIVFIHGNSDVAFGKGATDEYAPWQTGFRSLATYLDQNGWDQSELYTTTWGQVDPSKSHQNYHSKKVVLFLRAFIEAVIQYTKAKQIIVISHSMGVTLARKVIKGGKATDHIEGQYEVGENLSQKVKVFIGLGGTNLGLTSCYDKPSIATCNQVDGLFPGYLPSSGPSKFLAELNQNTNREGKKIFTIWSKYDDLIGYEGLVWGNETSRILSQDDQIIKDSIEWGHFHLRDNTGEDIFNWINQ